MLGSNLGAPDFRKLPKGPGGALFSACRAVPLHQAVLLRTDMGVCTGIVPSALLEPFAQDWYQYHHCCLPSPPLSLHTNIVEMLLGPMLCSALRLLEPSRPRPKPSPPKPEAEPPEAH